MDTTISTRFPPLPAETLRAKAAHLTVAVCFVVGAVVLTWSAFDELTCVVGEATSSGPCGIGIGAAGFVFPTGVGLAVIGVIVLTRALRRPVGIEASDAWRVGQALVVIASGILIGLMIPRYACPPGTHLSPVFRFCTSVDVAYPAPSPGLPWKFAAAGVGLLIGIVMIRWRYMPWWLASAVVAGAFLGAVMLVASRSTGIPLGPYRPYTVGVVMAGPVVFQTAVQAHAPPVRRTSPNGSAKWVGATIVPG